WEVERSMVVELFLECSKDDPKRILVKSQGSFGGTITEWYRPSLTKGTEDEDEPILEDSFDDLQSMHEDEMMYISDTKIELEVDMSPLAKEPTYVLPNVQT
ncbi:hypothetical protein Tco_0562652, partial [Tanacetum coccineum]